MNLSILQNRQTMSSREIAELTGKEHKNVMADVRKMLTELDKTLAEFSANLPDSYGRPQPCFLLPKDETICLMAGYDVKARMAIIKRWQELESQQQFKIPTTLSGALKLAYEQAEQIEAQQLLLEQQKPAVEFVERYVEARSSKCLSDVAKILKWKPREFIQTLAEKGVLFKRGGAWIPHQRHIDAGRFTVTTGEGNGHAYSQTRVEPDGIVWLAKNYKHA
jgi:phage antirepressor YoqD-like protein